MSVENAGRKVAICVYRLLAICSKRIYLPKGSGALPTQQKQISVANLSEQPVYACSIWPRCPALCARSHGANTGTEVPEPGNPQRDKGLYAKIGGTTLS